MSQSFIFIFSFVAWIAFELWVVFRERGGLQGKRKDEGSKIFLTIIVALGIILGLLMSRYAEAYAIHAFAYRIFVVGIFLMWFGILFRFWSIQTLGKYFRTIVLIQSDHVVVTHGPYKYLRHPAYTGSIITLFGIGLCFGNWLSVIVVVAGIILGYVWRIHVEEKLLVEHFGEKYNEYRKKTWAVIPFVW